MSHSCCIIDCKEKTFFSCSCSDSKYICQSHISSHMLSVGEHIPRKLFTRVHDNQKSQIIDYLSSCQKHILERIENLKTFTSDLIRLINSESQKAFKKLIQAKEKLKKQLKFFLTDSLIKTEVANLSKFEVMNTLHDLELLKVEKTLKAVFDLDSWCPLSKNDDFALVFLSTPGRNIDVIDLKSLKKQTIDLQMNDLLQNCICCKLDQSRYFVYGGFSPVLNSCSIIDLKNRTSEALPPSSDLYNAGACLFKNQVFIFGGSVGNYPQITCKRFILQTKTWDSIQSLPEANFSTTASFLNNRILVVGFQSSRVFGFNPHQNTFNAIKMNLAVNSWKFIFENWVVCFGSCLYEIDENDEFVNRQTITAFRGAALNSSTCFKRGRFLYFLIASAKLFRINTESKIFESVDFT